MKVTLVDYTENPEEKIASYASICYDSSTTPEANAKRIKKLMDVKHLATLRFASCVFHVEGISRTASHQIVRHPHLSFLQRSQRYCKDDQQEMVLPESIKGDALVDWIDAREACEKAYKSALIAGVPKGDARFILPQAVTTELYVAGNFQAWYDFLSKRLDKAAQWEIRAVAERMHEELMKIAPNVFGGLSASEKP